MFGHRRNLMLLSIFALLGLAAFTPSACAQSLSQQLRDEPVESLAKAARQKGNAVRGAIVFTQQNLACTRCHVAGNARPVGPDLTQLGKDVTDAYLVEALLQPSKVIRKGFESVTVVTTAGKAIPGRIVEQSPEQIVLGISTGDFRLQTLKRSDIDEIAANTSSAMPDNLADQLQNRDQFLDLVRYLMELAAADKNLANAGHSQGGQVISAELNGVVLLKEFKCSACHADDVTATQLGAKRAPDLTKSRGRLDPGFVARFIADPLHVKPGTTMPDVMAALPDTERKSAADEITHYLASLSDQNFARQPIDAEAAVRGSELFHQVGCIARHSPRDEQGRTPRADHLHARSDRREIQPRQPGCVSEGPAGSSDVWPYAEAAVNALGSDGRRELPAVRPERTSHRSGLATERVAGRKAQSEDLISWLPTMSPAAFDRGKPTSCRRKCDPIKGCLSGRDGKWPRFDLNASQRSAIQAALARKTKQHTPQDELALTLTAFRCLNCHQRGKLAGVSDERNPHFQTENPNLGPQGRIPPTRREYAKLNPDVDAAGADQWASYPTLRSDADAAVRTDNVARLVDLFQQQDELPPVEFAKVEDEKEIRQDRHRDGRQWAAPTA